MYADGRSGEEMAAAGSAKEELGKLEQKEGELANNNAEVMQGLQDEKDGEGDKAWGIMQVPELLGAKTTWCQHYLVQTLLSASATKCQHYLVPAVLVANTTWCQHYLMPTLLSASATWCRHCLVPALLGANTA